MGTWVWKCRLWQNGCYMQMGICSFCLMCIYTHIQVSFLHKYIELTEGICSIHLVLTVPNWQGWKTGQHTRAVSIRTILLGDNCLKFGVFFLLDKQFSLAYWTFVVVKPFYKDYFLKGKVLSLIPASSFYIILSPPKRIFLKRHIGSPCHIEKISYQMKLNHFMRHYWKWITCMSEEA